MEAGQGHTGETLKFWILFASRCWVKKQTKKQFLYVKVTPPGVFYHFIFICQYPNLETVLLFVLCSEKKININVHDLWIFLKKELCTAFHLASLHTILVLFPMSQSADILNHPCWRYFKNQVLGNMKKFIKWCHHMEKSGFGVRIYPLSHMNVSHDNIPLFTCTCQPDVCFILWGPSMFPFMATHPVVVEWWIFPPVSKITKICPSIHQGYITRSSRRLLQPEDFVAGELVFLRVAGPSIKTGWTLNRRKGNSCSLV